MGHIRPVYRNDRVTHRYTCEGGVCRLLEPEPDDNAVLISSERLTDDPSWSAVPVNHMLVIGEDRSVRLVALAQV